MPMAVWRFRRRNYARSAGGSRQVRISADLSGIVRTRKVQRSPQAFSRWGIDDFVRDALTP